MKQEDKEKETQQAEDDFDYWFDDGESENE